MSEGTFFLSYTAYLNDKKQMKGGSFLLKKILRIFITMVGLSVGYAVGVFINGNKLFDSVFPGFSSYPLSSVVINIGCALLFGLILFFNSKWIVKGSVKLAESTERELLSIPFNYLLSGAFGLVVGLLIAFLINPLFKSIIGIDIVYALVSTLTYGILGFLGIRLGTRYLSDVAKIKDSFKFSFKSLDSTARQEKAMPKVLDTSVIIDGRIADLCKTGFIEGRIIIAEFVLKELRHIADSSDDLKRVRGRRGLDILKILQNDLNLVVEISSEDFEDVNEVDLKLLKLAQKRVGAVVTNDYNLNKVAGIQGVKVLNINELTNAVKSVVLPGEEMLVNVIKEGKEPRQGVAYLDDGTMIVVEQGKKLIGKDSKVVVTSVLQTAAGRMIFAKPV